MQVNDLFKNHKIRLLCGDENKELIGCYIGDLLSLAMSKVQKDNIWITIQNNINIVAVASLTEAGCIIICEGFTLDDTILEKAKDEGVTVLTTELSEYEIASILVKNNI